MTLTGTTLQDYASGGAFVGFGIYPSDGLFSTIARIAIACLTLTLIQPTAIALSFQPSTVSIVWRKQGAIALTFYSPNFVLTWITQPAIVAFTSSTASLIFYAPATCP